MDHEQYRASIRQLEGRTLRAALCGLGLCVIGCGVVPSEPGVRSADSSTPIRVCTSSDSGTSVVAVYALERGMFEAHGLDVTLIPIESGSRAVAAMIAGDVQVCQIAGSAIVHAVLAGADLTMIGALVDRYLYSLMVSERIRTPADLKGKAVAVSAFGSSSDTAMRFALRELGLEPDRDVAVLAVGAQGERLAALQSGYIDGALLSPPDTFRAATRGLHQLHDLSMSQSPALHTGIATTRAFLAENRVVARHFMHAIVDAIASIKRDKDGAVEVLSRHKQLDVRTDAEALARTHDTVFRRRLLDVPYPPVAGVQRLVADITKNRETGESLTYERVVDTSIVRELEEMGVFRDLSRLP